MNRILVVGTDTDAGKTTFCLLWMSAFAASSVYWKPVESGPPDSATMRHLVPDARVSAPVASYAAALAPERAAQLERRCVPSTQELVDAVPVVDELLIESFGGPFSPLNATQLQEEFLAALDARVVLVTKASVGAVGRILTTLRALPPELTPSAVVLLGVRDAWAEASLAARAGLPVHSMQPPAEFSSAALQRAAFEQRPTLDALRVLLLPAHGTAFSTQQVAKNRSAPPDTSMPREAPSLVVRDQAVIWHPWTPLVEAPLPLHVRSAEREFLHLADGRTVVDGISSWWTTLFGHREPLLVQTLARAAATLDHVHFAGVTHEPAVALAERLLDSTPLRDGKVFFSDNGSTAVEVALKLAFQYWRLRDQPQRVRFIGFRDGYHGDTFGAMAVGRDRLFFGQFTPLLCAADILPLESVALDRHLEQHAHATAAIIVEPLLQAAGGMRVHTPELLAQIHACARKHNVLFIADEVMTAARTGSVWAFEQAGIAPDLVCAAKTLAGGMMPLAATLVAASVAEAFRSPDRTRMFFHGHSYTAHPLACAVAAANWARLPAQGPPAAQRIERYWNTHLEPLRKHRFVKAVRILGSMAAIEVDAAGGYLASVGREMARAALENDVLLRPLGPVVYALPPLDSSDASLRRIVTALHAAVDAADVSAALKPGR